MQQCSVPRWAANCQLDRDSCGKIHADRLLAIVRVADHIDDLGCNLFHRMRGGAARHTVGQRRRVVHDLTLGDVVPDRQQDLLSRQPPG